ncbi:MAG: hypothetical protein ACUBOA_03780 [Candidatus Loosdrechtia sp.]|uniref:hypothetical protein n=1 Tax=Candidatus Loosdrechtia sp. TaxID=3101272 RepID=UPI003A637D65|nr:MAG: hypothetical protein QY305_09860 [Candidatus Jettenia sp. AMX2]
MSKKNLITLFLFILACFLIVFGYSYHKKYLTIKSLEEKIAMGRYQEALLAVQQLQDSLPFKTMHIAGKEDPLISYNKGVLYSLLDDRKKASAEYRKAMEADNPVIKARAIYNNANLLATDMDFSTAALQYAEVLKIDANDFQAKKNLERMRLGEQQFNTMFSPEQQEREDRIEALKLLPWGTKYKYSGEQKIRW